MSDAKVNVHGFVILHMNNKSKTKREMVVTLTIPKADLPPVKADTMRTVLDKHADYIDMLINIHGRKQWPKDWFNYTEFEFGVVDVIDA